MVAGSVPQEEEEEAVMVAGSIPQEEEEVAESSSKEEEEEGAKRREAPGQGGTRSGSGTKGVGDAALFAVPAGSGQSYFASCFARC